MFCVPVSDQIYRKAARLAGIEELNLAPIEDEDFDEMRAAVDALLLNALQAGLAQIEARATVG